MRKASLILFLLIFLFQCEKKQSDNEEIKIIKSYTENPILGIEDTLYLNSNYFFSKSNSKSFTVKSYFDKKTISFQNDKNAEIKDFDQFKIVNISLDSIQELRKKRQKFYTISKPIISKDKNYAILETGVFNKKDEGFTIIGARELPDLIHVFLYKKENGVWNRFELITQIRM